jgi:mevalonate kinase
MERPGGRGFSVRLLLTLGTRMKATAVAPGKTILVGEHFVVYGEAAVVMAIDRHVHVTVEDRSDRGLYIASDLGVAGTFVEDVYTAATGGGGGRTVLEPIQIAAQTVLAACDEKRGLNIAVHSAIPPAVGLGSSGAVAVATVAAVGKLVGRDLSADEIISLSTAAETAVHRTPSGVDQAISTYGGVLVYQKTKGITRIKTASAIPLVIGNTGIQRNTGILVEGVRMKRERFPEIMDLMNAAANHISRQFIDALARDALRRLGELMDINQGLLMAIGVSHEALDRLVYAARASDALGAKLTGAGGGGCMIALTTLEGREQVAEALRRAGGDPIVAQKADQGVHCWIHE